MQLTESMIAARSRDSDLASIKRINLWGCELTDISIVSNMTNIEVLALSVNNLSCLKPLENCKKLQELYLRKNNIEDFSQLAHLQNLPSLTHLWLAENPCCVNAGANYRACVVKMLPNLKKLDEEMITLEDIELSKKLDSPQMETVRLNEELQKNNETQFHSPSAAMEHTNTLPQSSPLLDANKKSSDFNAMQQRSPTSFNSKLMQSEHLPTSNETQEFIPSSPIVPELNLKQRNSHSFSLNNTQNFNELQSPSKSFLLDQSNGSDHTAEKSQASYTMPLSFTSRSDCVQPAQKEVQFLDKTRSLSQIPQLNLVVQIHQPQSGIELPLQTPRSVSLQKINECADHDEKKRDQYQYQCEGAGDQTSRSNYQGSHIFKPRSAQEQRYEAGADNISQASTARMSQGHQNFLRFENATQTARSRYSIGSNNNNLYWNDDFRADRNSARSSSTLTTHSRSARRRNANVLAALLCIVPELDMQSLQVLDHSIQCRMDELSLE